TVQAGDKPHLYRIANGGEDNGCRRGRSLCCHCSRGGQGDDHSHLALNQIGGHGWQSIVLTSRPTLLGSDVLPFDKSKFVQALEKGGYERSPLSSCHATEKPNHRPLLPARRDWPRRRRTAEQRDELASLHRCNHSITSLAAASSLSGTVRPSIL